MMTHVQVDGFFASHSSKMAKWNIVLFGLSAFSILVSSHASFLRSQFANHDGYAQVGGDPGSPLFVTPYLEKGDVQTARKLATVGQIGNTSVKSYAGFFTVNSTYNSNMFFWFFPSQSAGENDPVCLWLQGGPGGSSLFGLFVENGPFTVDKDLNVSPKKFTWNKKYSMLYIDNPVGTGFSFTDKDAGYAKDEYDVAENLYRAMVQFYTMFPELNKNDLYLTGESYAGKYIPALAHRIHIEEHPKKIPLRGLAIGDGFSDPPTMVNAYADFMYNAGLLDEEQRDYFTAQVHIINYLVKQKQWAKAYEAVEAVNAKAAKDMGGLSWYNYLRSQSPESFGYYNKLLERSEVRRAMHVGNLTYHSGDAVEKHIVNDILQSVAPWLAEAMNYYKVLVYSGQLDIIVAAPLTELMLYQLDWKGADEYKRAERMVWKVNESDSEVAGYVRRVHDFYQVIVRSAGHILPYDQPERSFDMIDRFINDRPFA